MLQRGISLLEMLIALIILLTLMALTQPVLNELVHKYQASSYIQQFNRHLNYARVQATSSQQAVRVCPAMAELCSGHWQHDPVQLFLLTPSTDKAILLKEVPLPPQQHRLSYNRSQLQFRRDGSLDGLENGTFYYCPPARYQWHYRIVINQAGRSRLNLHQEACPL